MNSINKVVDALTIPGVKSATHYVEPDFVVTATHQRRPDNRASRNEIRLTMGKPNYRGREFIKLCKKAGVSFPVKKVQLRYYPCSKRSQGKTGKRR